MTKSTFDTPVPIDKLHAVADTLHANGFAAQVVADGAAAKQAVHDLIPTGSEVFTSTSVTLDEIGVSDSLNGPEYDSVRNRMMPMYGQPKMKKSMKQLAGAADVMVASVHAVTADGKLLIASASGSQLGLDVYGAEMVVFVVGSQKIVDDLDAGIGRIEKYIVPLEDARAKAAYGFGTSFSKLLVLNKEMPGRIHVILVDQALGY